LGSVNKKLFFNAKVFVITNLTSDYNKNIFGFKQMPYLISFYFILFIDKYYILAQQLRYFIVMSSCVAYAKYVSSHPIHHFTDVIQYSAKLRDIKLNAFLYSHHRPVLLTCHTVHSFSKAHARSYLPTQSNQLDVVI
jgi:hypothetical protein